jgi:hypothetical protein
MPISLGAGLQAAEQIDKCLELIKKYAAKLKADPDKAATDLAQALTEIEKSCRVLDDAISKYLAMGFQKDAFDASSTFLFDVSGGRLLTGVQDGRGSCHKMSNIYRNSLNRWFERVFKDDSQAMNELDRLFEQLGYADGDMFDLMVRLARDLQMSATEAVTLSGQGKLDEARDHVRAEFAALNPLRVRINELMAKLYTLRAEFIAIAGI